MDLVINGLSKTYANGVKALDNVSLTIPTGMFGLPGPNGAGKSSLMRILATLQEADAGTVTLGNTNVLNQKDEVRKLLGYLPQEFGVYPRVSAYQMLDHIALLKGVINNGQRKDLVEAKNHGEALIHSTSKSLAEFGDKVPAADKSAIEVAITDLKSVLDNGDAEQVKDKTNALAQASMKLGEAMYKAQAGQAEADAQRDAGAAGGADDVVDADFEEVKDDDKKV